MLTLTEIPFAFFLLSPTNIKAAFFLFTFFQTCKSLGIVFLDAVKTEFLIVSLKNINGIKLEKKAQF